MALYLLDKDPILAAQCLTVQHMELYVKRLRYSFCIAHIPKYKKPAPIFGMIAELKYSRENYVWFSEFYTELCRQIKTEKLIVPEFTEDFVFDTTGIKFKNNGLVLNLEEEKEDIDVVVNKNRIRYIKKKYPVQKFIGGYPSWYLKIDNNLFKKYDSRLKRDFKIVYDRNRYRYYIADYFNQWVEITDVPLEIDDFITTLLYKN